MLLRTIFGPKREEDGEHYVIRGFIICRPTPYEGLISNKGG
jgi:hypothetical protein